ncbi:hypothetical protein [Enterococcus sp. DIV0240a]|uniref:hypothetical protein n=1 Tax=Enterococcus sp. DIV0240a TaxID=2774651 RepID=UPI003D286C5D
MNEEEKNVQELENEAAADQFSSPENTTTDENDDVVEATDVVPNQEEAENATTVEPKEEFAAEVENNNAEMAAEEPSQVGSGAFSQARSSWANGWTAGD